MFFEASETIKMKVGGMHCAHCQAAVETALKNVKGVKRAAVDLEAAVAEITFVPKKTNPQALAEAVRQAGFEPELNG